MVVMEDGIAEVVLHVLVAHQESVSVWQRMCFQFALSILSLNGSKCRDNSDSISRKLSKDSRS